MHELKKKKKKKKIPFSFFMGIFQEDNKRLQRTTQSKRRIATFIAIVGYMRLLAT